MRNGKCRNGDNCNYSHEIDHLQKNNLDNNNNDTNNKKRQLNDNTSNIKSNFDVNHNNPIIKKLKQNNNNKSLLEKLLKEDVRRENVLTIKLLKCIVDTNFLTTTSTTNKTKSNTL